MSWWKDRHLESQSEVMMGLALMCYQSRYKYEYECGCGYGYERGW